MLLFTKHKANSPN